jgi:hypothetical protein
MFAHGEAKDLQAQIEARCSTHGPTAQKNGRNQAVRIPREWGLPGKTAMVTQDGARLIL